MDTEKYIVAIEIGSSKITGAIATRSQKGDVVSILGIDSLPISGAIKRGIVVKPGEVSAKIKKLLLMLGNRIGSSKKITRAYVGIAGQSLHTEDYTISQDYPENTAITDELICRLQEEVKEMPIASADVLEVVCTDVLIDGTPRMGHTEVVGSNLKMGLKLVTARKALKSGAAEAIPSTLSVVKYVPLDLATSCVALSTEDRQAGVMLVDFGAETTTVSIYKNGVLNYLSTIPLGGANITRDIMSLQVTEEEAESFKTRLGSAKMTGEEPDITLRGEHASEIKSFDLSKVVKARIEEIVANVDAHFEYAKCDPKSLGAGMVIIGGASKLSNLAELLADKCGIRVRKGSLRQDMLLDLASQSKSADLLQILGLIFCADEECVEVGDGHKAEPEAEPIAVKKPKFKIDWGDDEEDFEPEPAPAPKPKKEKKKKEKKPQKEKGPSLFSQWGQKLRQFAEKTGQLLDDDDTWEDGEKQRKND